MKDEGGKAKGGEGANEKSWFAAQQMGWVAFKGMKPFAAAGGATPRPHAL
jgi:hypothetical protein